MLFIDASLLSALSRHPPIAQYDYGAPSNLAAIAITERGLRGCDDKET
jgi:hypothetical protein